MKRILSVHITVWCEWTLLWGCSSATSVSGTLGPSIHRDIQHWPLVAPRRLRMPGVSVRKRLGKHWFVSFERSLGQRDWFEQTLSITQSNCLCFSAQRLVLAFSSYSMPFIPGLNEQLATFYSMFYNPRLISSNKATLLPACSVWAIHFSQ